MIKNKLSSLKGLDSYNNECEVNACLLKFDGAEYILMPGEMIDVMQKFKVNKDEAALLEARFMNKFPGMLSVVDTQKELARIENERAAEKIEKIKKVKSPKEVKDLLKGEKNGDVVNAGIEKIEEIGKLKP